MIKIIMVYPFNVEVVDIAANTGPRMQCGLYRAGVDLFEQCEEVRQIKALLHRSLGRDESRGESHCIASAR